MRLALLKRSRWKVLTYILLDLSYKFEFNQTNKKSKSSSKEKNGPYIYLSQIIFYSPAGNKANLFYSLQ